MLKRDTNVYLQTATNSFYKLPVYNDLSYSQVYSEEQLSKKTLHNPDNLLADGFASGLNPGNFSFTIPIIDTTIAQNLAELFAEHNPSANTIYIENDGTIVRLNKCVVQNVVFNFSKEAISTLTVSGSFASTSNSTLPVLTIQNPGIVYTFVEGLEVRVNGDEVENITSINIEISNEVNWLQNQTMHDTAPVARENFVVSEKTVSATVVANQPISNAEYFNNTAVVMTIRSTNSNFLVFTFNPSIVSTRNQLDEVTKKGYDIRAKDYTITYRGVTIT